MIRAVLLLLALAPGPLLLAEEGEADRAALRRILSAYEEALNTNELVKIAPFLSASFQGIMVTGETVQGEAGLESFWRKMRGVAGSGGSYSVSVTPGEISLSGNLAIGTASAEEVVKAQGQRFPYTSTWTTICRREGTDWKLERLQATMDPIDNVFVRARTKGAGLQYGIVGFIMGGTATALLLIGYRRSRAAAKRKN